MVRNLCSVLLPPLPAVVFGTCFSFTAWLRYIIFSLRSLGKVRLKVPSRAYAIGKRRRGCWLVSHVGVVPGGKPTETGWQAGGRRVSPHLSCENQPRNNTGSVMG